MQSCIVAQAIYAVGIIPQWLRKDIGVHSCTVNKGNRLFKKFQVCLVFLYFVSTGNQKTSARLEQRLLYWCCLTHQLMWILWLRNWHHLSF